MKRERKREREFKGLAMPAWLHWSLSRSLSLYFFILSKLIDLLS
jgi:hypothetical protein